MKNLTDAQLDHYSSYFVNKMRIERNSLKGRFLRLWNVETREHRRLGDQLLQVNQELVQRQSRQCNQVQYAEGSIVGGEVKMKVKDLNGWDDLVARSRKGLVK